VTTRTAPAAAGHLSRILGLGFGIAVIFGGTVGVGILRLPGEVAGKLGSAQLVMLVWIVGGIYSMLGAISISEVAAALPQAGGFYVYSRRAFGPAVGFGVGWADWMVNCTSIAYATVAAAEYLQALAPELLGHSSTVQTGVALGLLLFFCVLQWFGLRIGSSVQKMASLATGLTFIALAAACLLHGRTASPVLTPLPIAGHGAGWMSLLVPIVAVLPAIVVAYDGWYEAIYFGEENTNATRNLPRAMIGSVVLITGLYLLMNLSFLHVLSIGELGASKLAAADAARVVFPRWSGDFVTVLSLLTLLSLTNALLLGAPRILFAVGRDGLFPSAAKVGAGGTPRIALLVTAGMIGIIELSGKFDDIVAVAAILMASTYCVNYVAVFVLRAREPELPRPFRAWGYPVTTGLVLAGSLTFLIADVIQDPVTALRAAVLLAVAAPVYLGMRWRARRLGH
jgi:APA family basic amino acid/polyamine antiporter